MASHAAHSQRFSRTNQTPLHRQIAPTLADSRKSPPFPSPSTQSHQNATALACRIEQLKHPPTCENSPSYLSLSGLFLPLIPHALAVRARFVRHPTRRAKSLSHAIMHYCAECDRRAAAAAAAAGRARAAAHVAAAATAAAGARSPSSPPSSTPTTMQPLRYRAAAAGTPSSVPVRASPAVAKAAASAKLRASAPIDRAHAGRSLAPPSLPAPRPPAPPAPASPACPARGTTRSLRRPPPPIPLSLPSALLHPAVPAYAAAVAATATSTPPPPAAAPDSPLPPPPPPPLSPDEERAPRTSEHRSVHPNSSKEGKTAGVGGPWFALEKLGALDGVGHSKNRGRAYTFAKTTPPSHLGERWGSALCRPASRSLAATSPIPSPSSLPSLLASRPPLISVPPPSFPSRPLQDSGAHPVSTTAAAATLAAFASRRRDRRRPPPIATRHARRLPCPRIPRFVLATLQRQEGLRPTRRPSGVVLRVRP